MYISYQTFFGLALCAGTALSIPLQATADDVTDFYFQQTMERYFDVPQNARTFGMAGSSVLTATDSSSILGNPAGLGFMQGGEFSASYGHNRVSGTEFPTGASIEQRSNSGHSLLAVPVGPTTDGIPQYGNFGAGWAMSDGTWDNDSFETDTEQQQVSAAYAIPLNKNLSLGYGLTWTDDHLQSQAIFNYPMGDGFRHTLGLLWQSGPRWTVGSRLLIGHGEHHALFGPGIEGNSKTREVGFGVGSEYKMSDRTVLAMGLDYRHLNSDGEVVASIPQNIVGGDENGNIYDARIGIEHSVDSQFTLRGGYRFAGLASYNYNRVELNRLNGSANYSAFTLGAGYKFIVASDYIDSVNLDYGVEYREVGDGDWEHLVTISVPFELCQPA